METWTGDTQDFLVPKALLPGGSEVKVSACNAGDPGSIPGLGRSPGEGNGNPLQYSCLENPKDRGAWWATVYGVAKSRTRLSDFTSLRLFWFGLRFYIYSNSLLKNKFLTFATVLYVPEVIVSLLQCMKIAPSWFSRSIIIGTRSLK